MKSWHAYPVVAITARFASSTSYIIMARNADVVDRSVCLGDH